ncbi:hypothetical protein F4811DRAFT_535618, partial [Daldinia bambusicola]
MRYVCEWWDAIVIAQFFMVLVIFFIELSKRPSGNASSRSTTCEKKSIYLLSHLLPFLSREWIMIMHLCRYLWAVCSSDPDKQVITPPIPGPEVFPGRKRRVRSFGLGSLSLAYCIVSRFLFFFFF